MTQKLDQFHQHEALDRCSVFINIIESELLRHEFVQAHKKIKRLVESAANDLAQAYQLIGAKELNK